MTQTPAWLSLDELNQNLGPLAQTMGIRFLEASLEEVVATMPVAPNRQPYGLLHGGASVVLGETVGSMLAVLQAGHGRAAVGVSINAIHHRAVTDGSVRATGTVLHAGRSIASILIEITDDEQRRVCTCTLTCQLRDLPPRREVAGGATGAS